MTTGDWVLLLGGIAGLVVAGGGFLTALGAVVGSVIAARMGARKSEVDLLRQEVERLSSSNARLFGEVNALHEENLQLRATLQQHGIDVPPLKARRTAVPAVPAVAA